MFRQNKRATDVHDIIGFRIIVQPKNPDTRTSAAAAVSGRQRKKRKRHTPVGTTQHRAMEEKGPSKRARSVFTVKTFPPPYRDADSRLLHDVYEVLVGLYEEVQGRFKVRSPHLSLEFYLRDIRDRWSLRLKQ